MTHSHTTAIPAQLHAQNNHNLATKVRNRRASLGMRAHPPVVYFMQAGETGAVKIGWTENVDHRMDCLQVGVSDPLILRASLRGGRDLERKIHKYFAKYHIRGEWFQSGPVLNALANAGFLGREAA